jgi:hypothetical protein
MPRFADFCVIDNLEIKQASPMAYAALIGWCDRCDAIEERHGLVIDIRGRVLRWRSVRHGFVMTPEIFEALRQLKGDLLQILDRHGLHLFPEGFPLVFARTYIERAELYASAGLERQQALKRAAGEVLADWETWEGGGTLRG